MERTWTLGEDLDVRDNLLDGVLIKDLIDALHQERVIDESTAEKVFDEIMENRMGDARFILFNNIEAIVAEAKKGRE